MKQNPMDRPHRPHEGPNAGKNFVAPYAKPAAPTVAQPIQIMHEDGQQFPVQVAQIDKTSAVDRAKGFSIKTNQLSMVTSALATIAAMALGASGFLFIASIALGGYFITWGLAFWLDNRTSPGGIARQIAGAKLRESGRHSRDYSDAYRAAQGLPGLKWWERWLS